MKFALFFLAEYVNVFIVCAIGATYFLADGCHCISATGRVLIMRWIISRPAYGSLENIFPNIRHYVVQVDIPKIEDRPVTES
jgi:NADH:ubiquinone oxidoreductase subunit H